jgi:hypothetical protein
MPPLALLDTSVLVECPHIHELDWGVPEVHVYVLHSAVEELHGLARDRRDREKARAAEARQLMRESYTLLSFPSLLSSPLFARPRPGMASIQ